MASQPFNTTIQVYRTVRGQRRSNWPWDSAKNLTGHMRPLELMVPGVENRTYVVARDTTSVSADYSSFMGAASATASRGFPIVVGPVAVKEFTLVANLTGINYPITIGQDRFVEDDASHLASHDLHQLVRNL